MYPHGTCASLHLRMGQQYSELTEISWGAGKAHMINEKDPGCLGYLGDEILPSYVGITINHYKYPY